MKYLLTCLTAILLFSCETLVNDIDPAKLGLKEASFVINSYISPSDSLVTVYIHLTKPIFTTRPTNNFNREDSVVTNAKVEISSKTQKISLLYNPTEKIYMAKKGDFKVVANETYSLKVTDASGKLFTSNTTVPQPIDVKIENLVERQNPQNEQIYKNRSFELTLELDLKPNSYVSASSDLSYKIINTSTKKAIPIVSSYGINTDNLKNESSVSQKQKIKPIIFISYDSKAAFDLETKLKIYNFDKNLHVYSESVDDNDEGGNPFVEPTLIKSNIKGALGCFGSYNLTEKVLPIKY